MSSKDNADGRWTWETALGGVIPPIITPLHTDGEVDVRALNKVVEHVLDGGCSGIFALGSTGEGLWLTMAQGEAVVRATVAASRGCVPVLVGIMLPATAPAREAVRRADALVVGSPYCLGVGPDDQRRHIEAILAAVDLPIVLCNIPQCTHHAIQPETAAALASNRRVIGIKDSARDPATFMRYLRVKGRQPGFRVLLGDGALMVAEQSPSADGLVPGTANIAPHQAIVAGDRTTWQRVRQDLLPINSMILQLGYPDRVIKAACAALGLGNGHPALPHAPFDEPQRQAIAPSA